MTIAEAKQKVKNTFKISGLTIGSILDDGEYFIFGYVEEVDIAPLGVNKKTGEVMEYSPPDHYTNFMKAKEVESTVK